MPAFKWCALSFSLFLSAVSASGTALTDLKKGGVTIPLVRRRLGRRSFQDGDVVGGTIGLGDYLDTSYTAVAMVGNSSFALELDTKWEDISVISTSCKKGLQCTSETLPRYNTSISFEPIGSPIMGYNITEDRAGHSIDIGARVGRDTVTFAGLTLPNQSLVAIDNFTTAGGAYPFDGAVGRLGLAFPTSGNNLAGLVAFGALVKWSISFVDGHVLTPKYQLNNSPSLSTLEWEEQWLEHIQDIGGFIPRLVASGGIERPLFAITLQRETIDISGNGQLTIGRLPDGIDESNITWVPVRLIPPEDGGWASPSFAPNETYPRGWEIVLDAVFFDGKNVTDNTTRTSHPTLSAAIDIHNNHLVAPNGGFGAIQHALGSDLYLDCSKPYNLTFQIGGKLFPVDPRDFYTSLGGGNTARCSPNVEDRSLSLSYDEQKAPYNWTLGVPFLKSNAVVFYFGNLTHPSADPPKIGLVSFVPEDVGELLQSAVSKAEGATANLPEASQAAPTNSQAITRGASSATATSRSSPATTSASNAGGVSHSPGEAFVRMVLLLVLRAFML
ncbi:hypothetical protein GSI_14391 [Ganoderma sinense ZZ0214-1]|uniref:Peptidase A1 domain-containing protein n=1 Tax=Ganoderma sinense ZZ0214-1 TaxID=1077348 RepID=A0A2G8RNK2_9APHY|nr:hypothetical protein GSI_14391 [Ganoderma sinense ZZ0214-1]